MPEFKDFQRRPAVIPQIYAYVLPGVPSHDGYIKVGYTDREDVNKRIREQLHTAAIKHKLLFVESAMRDDGTCFTDHDIHAALTRHGYEKLCFDGDTRNEWFKCSEKAVRAAIITIRNETENVEERTETFLMRPEQARAVKMTMDYYIKAKREEPDRTPKFLWNAKMRFGKTFAAYELAKAMGFKRVLILTFKPAVESAWRDDLMRHIDFEGWQFVSNRDAHDNNLNIDTLYDKADKDRPIVVFGSFQDLLGTNENGGIKAKNEFIHSDNWDLVIFDEYHFGAWRENAANLFEKDNEEDTVDFDAEEYGANEAGNAYNESFLPITTSHYLFLSGTPFRALNSGEFIEEQIFNWTYTDEQREKAAWHGPDNPYAALPRMVLLTYKIPDSIRQIALQGEFNEFDLNVFFSAKLETPGKVETAKFVYEDEVQKWLSLIRGAYLPANIDDLKLGMDKRPPMPYSDGRLLGVLTHTLWFLPNVASCYAMYNLLKKRQNNFYHEYTINICAGARAGVGLSALEPVRKSMRDPLKNKTITLSCGKLTTGVTVRPWSGVFMLRNLKSPETYFQTAFRVQSPWTVRDDYGNTTIVKPECYIFDFALERALQQVSDYSCRLNPDEANPEKNVAEFINFLPVLAYDGSSMKQVSAQDVLDIALSGTSATLLARRWQSALLVNVDNDTLRRLMDSEEAMSALSRIEAFRNLNQDIKTIINRTKDITEAKGKKETLTDKEKKELTTAEKELRTKRKEIQEKLMKFATRIPDFMYLTDYRERSLKDVISQFEPGLFTKITGLTVDDFSLLCTLGVFNASLMNQAIFNFKRYEDSSLSYTGIDKNADKAVGGWDTVLRREEYEKMFYNQQKSMESVPSASKEDIPFVEPEPKAENSQTHATPSRIEPMKPVLKPLPSKEETYIPPKVNIGDAVIHSKFGRGIVVKFENNNKYINVQFKEGNKTFLYSFAFEKGFLTLDGGDVNG